MPTTTDSITIKGRTVTRADVEGAIKQCDEMGQKAFLAHYGFGPSQTYWLRGPKTHRPYPSKAILAVAAGCTKRHGWHGQFFGGVAHTVNQLNRLNFQVRDGDEPVRSAGIDAYREAAIEAGFDDPMPAWKTLPVTPVAVFASGTNSPNLIAACAAVRMDVGVAAPHVSAKTEAALLKLAGTDEAVFVDSGAFSEVKYNPTKMGFDVVQPITDAKWQSILGLYQRLGDALHSNAWVVAPDQVGSQTVTLQRLTTYAPELAKIADTGAIVMVVAQKGAMSQADFYRAALHAAGLEGRLNVIPALPCKKAATTPEEAKQFVDDLKPDHVHCLGLGPTNPKIHKYMQAFVGTATSVSLDSCWITANVGKAVKKRKERRFTKAQRIALQVMATVGKVGTKFKLELAMLLCLGAPIAKLDAVSQLAFIDTNISTIAAELSYLEQLGRRRRRFRA